MHTFDTVNATLALEFLAIFKLKLHAKVLAFIYLCKIPQVVLENEFCIQYQHILGSEQPANLRWSCFYIIKNN